MKEYNSSTRRQPRLTIQLTWIRRQISWRFYRRVYRRFLLSSVSVAALLALAAPAPGHAADNTRGGRAQSPTAAATKNAIAAARAAAIAGAQSRSALTQASRSLAQSSRSLAQTTQSIQAVRAAQTAARASLQASTPLVVPAVPDGLVDGGLKTAAGTPLNPIQGQANDPTLWQGALDPTSRADGDKVIVDIQQTQQKAILNWETFNVGAKTTVNFHQNDTDWTVLNRVIDPAARPSTILGSINAPGTVLLINPKGILFGNGAQVNVHSLVASSLDVGRATTDRLARDKFFLNQGIASLATGDTSFSTAPGAVVSGDVIVDQGARITSHVVDPDSPGYVYLFGGNVRNSGVITSKNDAAPEGKDEGRAGDVVLIAARSIALTPNVYESPTGTGSEAIRGTGFAINRGFNIPTTGIVLPYLDNTGQVTNDGLIDMPRSNVIMNGDRIQVGGVISADTSITRNSKIFIDAVTSVDMTGTISIQPYSNKGESLPLNTSDSQTFQPASVKISAYDVTLKNGALIKAPGADVKISAYGASNGNFGLIPKVDRNLVPQRILMESGSTIDVSGLRNVQLDADYNIVAFQPRGTEFADFPLQKDGPLVGKTLYIDIRDSGTRADGTKWVGTPIADASGFIGLVGQSIEQLLTVGGTVNLKTELSRPGMGDVILRAGSRIDVSGGNLTYKSGFVPTTTLRGSDGRLYAIDKADPNIAYVGLGNEFIVEHERAGITEVFQGPPGVTRKVFQPGYTEGRDAGGVSITTNNLVVERPQDAFQFGSTAGERQLLAGRAASGARANGVAKQASTGELPSQGYLSLETTSSVVFNGIGGAGLPDNFAADAPLPPPAAIPATPSNFYQSNSPYQIAFSAQQVSDYGLSGLIINANDLTVAAGSTVKLAAGGQFTAKTAGAIDIEGTIKAPGGRIALTTDAHGIDSTRLTRKGTVLRAPLAGQNPSSSDIMIGSAAELDVRGRWVNDFRAGSGSLNGPGFINGGSIALSTNNSSFGGAETTGNIFLSAGSLLDVSSGGYINAKGVQQTTASGVPAGKGGNISLAVYQGSFDEQGQNGLPQTPTSGAVAQVHLDGELRGYGFSSGGSLTLAAPGSIQIGGNAPGAATGMLLPTSFFSSGGFANYDIQSADTSRGLATQITLVAGETLTAQQQNYSNITRYLDVPTDENIGKIAPIVTLPGDLRAPVNLTLSGDRILLDVGSTIKTDPTATITLQPMRGAQNSSALLRGTIIDNAGLVKIRSNEVWLGAESKIDLSGIFIENSQFGLTRGPAISGKLLPGGTLSFEGTIVNNQSTGFVIAETGATVDISGAKGILTGRSGPGSPLTNVESWSDGGTVSIDTGSLIWGGTVKADAGDPQGNRGTLILGGGGIELSQNIDSLLAQLALVPKPTDAAAVAAFANPYAGKEFVYVDMLKPFDDVYLYSGVGGAAQFFSNGMVSTGMPGLPLLVNGDVNLDVANRLYISASRIEAKNGVGNSVISAPYINLSLGNLKISELPVAGAGSITFKAQGIDIRSVILSRFAHATFESSGDLRLMAPPLSIDGLPVNGAKPSITGAVISAGDLSLIAERTYPVSAVDFTIASTSPTGTIEFGSPNGRNLETPLSAGGSLTVAAATILQDGNLFAPSGQIVLGAQTTADLSPNDPFRQKTGYFVATSQVTLADDSVTSVSLGGNLVPFGQTEDGTNWFYNTDTSPLAVPPSKTVKLLGKSVTVEDQATMDLRGGGDLQAIEFIPGKGGSRDVLTTGADGKTVYALLPWRKDAIATYDVDFSVLLGDAQPRAGQQVFLSGGNGIPAGIYTLYPAHYATLPGALRVVDYGSALAKPRLLGATLSDGTQIVGGYYTQSLVPGRRSSGQQLFAIQTDATWRQYSEISSVGAIDYFRARAAHDGIAPPMLGNDAGRLVIGAVNSLTLSAASALTSPGSDGRGGQLDIAGPKIEVVAPGQTAEAGYTAIDAAQLSAAGFESILIGGVRNDTAAGTQITPTALSVLVDTQGTALTASEVILVATAPTKTASVPIMDPTDPTKVAQTTTVTVADDSAGAKGDITVRSGSIIEAKGDIAGGTGHSYVLGVAAPASVASIAELQTYATDAARGLGSLLMVSSDPNASVTRNSPSSMAQTVVKVGTIGNAILPPAPGAVGTLTIAGGATVTGSEQLLLDATASTQAIKIDSQATVGAKSVTIATSSIGIGANPSLNHGFVITPAVLAQLSGGQSLTLRTRGGAIQFYDTVEFNAAKTLKNVVLDTPALIGGGENVTIGAGGTLTLVNNGASAAFPFTSVTGGTLALDAAQIVLGGGDMGLAGFGDVRWTASDMVFAQSSGSIKVGANADPVDLTVTTPNLRVGAKTSGGGGDNSQFVIETLGDFALARPAGASATPTATDEIGGNLLIKAASIHHAGTIQALAGTVTLQATTGNVVLDEGSLIAAGGVKQSLFDADKYIRGGKVVLTADLGDVTTAVRSVIDVSQPAGGLGAGGEIFVNAPGGNADIKGSLLAAGGPGLGGAFHMNSKGGANLDGLARLLGLGGVTGEIDIHTREGNLVLSAGETLTAHIITLTVDDPTQGNGRIDIQGTIDASGFSGDTPDGSREAGGTVDLWAYNAITLGSTGRIVARTSHADERGGDVTVGIVDQAGFIDFQPGSLIDVSGGEAGGTLKVRAPIVVGQNEVPISEIASDIIGARSVTVEAYVTVTAGYKDAAGNVVGGGIVGSGQNGILYNNGTTARVIYFDGIIDPAGLYDSAGNHIEGYWKDSSGNIIAVEYGGQRYVKVGNNFVINPQGLDPDQGNLGGTFTAASLALSDTPSGKLVIGFTDNPGLYNQDHIDLYGALAAQFVQGKSDGLGFLGANKRLVPTLAPGVENIFHFQPGIDLVNNDTTVNKGNITVASNWNLAAGTASKLGSLANGNPYFDPQNSQVEFLYRYGIEPGNLTLRAINDIQINASISDGFFQFRNYSDSSYQQALTQYLSRGRRLLGALDPSSTTVYGYVASSFVLVNQGGVLTPLPVPIAPYSAAANGVSPDAVALASADLFPHALNVVDNRDHTTVHVGVGMDSWSYRFTGGADIRSANPNAVGSLSIYGAAGRGDVVIDKHNAYQQPFQSQFAGLANATVHLPTMVRTGTGGIDVNAARNLVLADHFAPGVIYTAGRNTALLPDPGYTAQGSGAQARVTATNPDGFLEPQLLRYGTLVRPTGPLNAAAFPEQAGDIDIHVGEDILGFQNVVLNNVPDPRGFGTLNNVPYHQLFAPWLLSMAQTTATTDSRTTGSYGAGIFAPQGLNIAQQSAWWIQFGSFDQGVLSAGGNVTITAGRDVRDLSVSLPSTGRVSGGLSASSTPVTHVYGSGNLTMNVGRDLYSGAIYEGSGHASIAVGGSVRTTNWSGVGAAGTTTPVGTVLAVDSGQIDLTASGSIAIANIINPAELHPQTNFNLSGINNQPLFMDTYGPDSRIGVISIGGDVGISANLALFNSVTQATQTLAQTYPATFEVTALSGSITTQLSGSNSAQPQNVILSDSENGVLSLLARDTLDLSGGLTKTLGTTNAPIFSAGASLIDMAFNAYRPNGGSDESSSRTVLAHANDTEANRFYAVDGDIIGYGSVKSSRPTKARAGQDIVDLNLIAQNIRRTDVSSVIAGRDIYYTGFANFGGLQIAGPGFFLVEAGRDLGPFMPAAFNNATRQVGIVSSGNATQSPVGNDVWVPNRSVGPENLQYKNKRNFLLPDEGADIIALFGVKNGADYKAVIDRYIDPQNSGTAPHNYLQELRAFLKSLGIDAASDGDAWTTFQGGLSSELRQIFVTQVFFDELKSASTGKYQRGYEMVNTLFPASLGYTENQLGGGTNGANALIHTGDLEMLHATIQTQHGGKISIMGPGGSVLVGSTALEPNKNLKLRDLGIQTQGGGAIDIFTDLHVLVNQSRIFTMQGGDIVMWSSNGDLNAGRGARTTTSLPPLVVVIDNDNVQTIDLGGLVTGAGIAVLKSSAFAEDSNAYLIAPRGTVDAGDAGIRVSGNLAIAAAFVANADNISVGGESSGIPAAPSVNVSALSAASSTAAAASGSADAQPHNNPNQNNLPSIFTVEVLGYGEPSDEDIRRWRQRLTGRSN